MFALGSLWRYDRHILITMATGYPPTASAACMTNRFSSITPAIASPVHKAFAETANPTCDTASMSTIPAKQSTETAAELTPYFSMENEELFVDITSFALQAEKLRKPCTFYIAHGKSKRIYEPICSAMGPTTPAALHQTWWAWHVLW